MIDQWLILIASLAILFVVVFVLVVLGELTWHRMIRRMRSWFR